MRFSLTRPCALCPFRTDLASGPCHETTGVKGPQRAAQHCAGALIMLERANLPSQAMRIAERLGIYDRRKLDMGAPVYDSPASWVQAHQFPKDRER